jgi:hypothetical protein
VKRRTPRLPEFAIAIVLALLFTSPALAHDASSASTPLTFGSQARADTSAYSVETGEQNTSAPFRNQCGAPYNVGVARTAWYAVQGTGGPITVTTVGSDYDTALFVYAGSPTGGVVACDDDTAAGVNAVVSFASTEGTTYDIQVGRACNEGPTPACADKPSAGALAITANGTMPGTPIPTPGTPAPGTPGPGGPTPQALVVQNRLAPSITGVAVRGRLLSCERGEWTGTAPLTYALEWQRDGKTVARGARYRVVAADVSRRLACKVTATGPGGSAFASSEGVTPATTRAEVVLLPTGAGIKPPPNAPLGKGCRGLIALTLFKDRRILGRHTVPLNAHCRWSWAFQVSRKQLGNARTLRLKVHFGGNLYLNSGTTHIKVPVPRS